ncbi:MULTISPECIES: AarF/ABC1/UbiB kinase family protein [unclassified Neisseria]|uniref:ABC1 kinase family protein n=1 Tax=unclassified Neisseria TaxID=2623750 RepID=UPI00266621AE|nr:MULTISPECIES: AarF/UbiB family protein [unclassified Neisseria]MDO1510120.1 AarF/UbiB family protein [Neisseria sp. MVDL19-042950]MDO1516696.1 AarF/UbiB family protein [Neisseria sp. MVDL18-041461]MDO1563843.1 AarF/UbiB family protein [Neisseria sp. MVDL20-010259]
MMIPTLLAMRDFSRMREIIAILTKYGLGEFVQRIKLSYQNSNEGESAPESRYMSTPRRFRMAFEELGPTFVKLGQVLSTRVDIFNAEWIEEFERLQSDVAPIPTTDIRALIESHLDRPVASVFKHIDPQPIGSASIAQVHRAELINGETVAVKIKRPDIEPTIQADLRILTHLANLIESEIPEARRYRPVQMVQYFSRSLAKETDLSVELRYMQRFETTFQNHPFIHIPKVYQEYSNRHILVQEYVCDTLLKDTPSETLDPDTRRTLAGRITDTLFIMILKQGFFHADPHPGNIFLNSEGRITLIDFGLVGHLSSTRRREIIDLINALTRRDQFTMQYVLSNWAQGELPDENLLGADVLEMLLNYEHTPIRDLRISQVINDITQIMRRHGLTLPGDLVMLFKTLITLEGVVKRLDGSTELLEQAKPIVAEVFRERASPEHILRKSKMHAQTIVQALDELPQNLFRLSRRLQKGQVGLNIDFKHFDQFSHQIDRATNRLTMGIVTAALIIGSSIVMSIETGPKFVGFLGYLLAFANSIWIIWSIWRSSKH